MRPKRFWIVFIAAAITFASLADASLQAAEVGGSLPDQESALIEILRTGPKQEKAMACKKLTIYGTKACVPELEKFLGDEQLASWARIALEAIPGPAPNSALRNAVPSLKGQLLVGVVNSIGVRRDRHAEALLIGLLKDPDVEVAKAAAVALGHIGTQTAYKNLRESLTSTSGELRSAVAQGCILCAERQMAENRNDQAAEIYKQVRSSELPKQRIIEATRGEILARGEAGIPLLIEQLHSPDKKFFQLGLMVARQSQAPGVGDALAADLVHVSPERAALLLRALADRAEHVVPPAVVKAAQDGEKPVRIAAIEFIGRWGDASSISALLQSAADSDPDLAHAAKSALSNLRGQKVDAEIASGLSSANSTSLPVLIELTGQRRIAAATPALVAALDNSDSAVRRAALTALGNTVGQDRLSVLIAALVSPKEPADAAVAKKALLAASTRMPDRDVCSAELAAALPQASASGKASLLEILGAVEGQRALQAIDAVMKQGNPELQDVGSRVLGSWMSVDAAPVLLDLAKTSHDEKYQVRALRGYIRLARQFGMSPRDRADMCAKALDAAKRPEERKLALAVLQRYPGVDTLRVAIQASEQPETKKAAEATVVKMAQKLVGKSTEAEQMIAKAGIELPRVQIVKAEYGAGGSMKDVTDFLQARTNVTPQIDLPSANFNESFGGDPAPNVVKQLKIQYRINGKTGEATFAENAKIDLPMPK
jgi:HEAT repeat protein